MYRLFSNVVTVFLGFFAYSYSPPLVHDLIIPASGELNGIKLDTQRYHFHEILSVTSIFQSGFPYWNQIQSVHKFSSKCASSRSALILYPTRMKCNGLLLIEAYFVHPNLYALLVTRKDSNFQFNLSKSHMTHHLGTALFALTGCTLNRSAIIDPIPLSW